MPRQGGLVADGPLVVGIGGSTGAASVSGALLHAVLAVLGSSGARTVAFGGERLAALPIYRVVDHSPDGAAAELADAVRAADAVVIATPGYHGGMSGLVKNALDHLELLRADERPYLTGRAVGVVVTAAGWQACGTALVAVRSAVHALRGWPTPFGMTVNTSEQELTDERVRGGLQILASQLSEFTRWQIAARVSDACGANEEHSRCLPAADRPTTGPQGPEEVR